MTDNSIRLCLTQMDMTKLLQIDKWATYWEDKIEGPWNQWYLFVFLYFGQSVFMKLH